MLASLFLHLPGHGLLFGLHQPSSLRYPLLARLLQLGHQPLHLRALQQGLPARLQDHPLQVRVPGGEEQEGAPLRALLWGRERRWQVRVKELIHALPNLAWIRLQTSTAGGFLEKNAKLSMDKTSNHNFKPPQLQTTRWQMRVKELIHALPNLAWIRLHTTAARGFWKKNRYWTSFQTSTAGGFLEKNAKLSMDKTSNHNCRRFLEKKEDVVEYFLVENEFEMYR